MISGIHCIIYSNKSDSDRAFFRDIFQIKNIDIGDGWLIFGLPASELAIHPAETTGSQEVFLLCDDINDFISEMQKKKVQFTPIQKLSWGLLTRITIPSGIQIGVYQPLHLRPNLS